MTTARADLGLEDKEYAVLTLHRPSNVDDAAAFVRVIEALEKIAGRLPIVFPAHPRTRKMIEELRLGTRVEQIKNLFVIDPVGYLDFLQLLSGARLVLTDSGGIQEETTVLGIPCVTLRENTERPITVEMGTNTIAGTDPASIVKAAFQALDNPPQRSALRVPPLWDGQTADRILDALREREG
jgi:UDP-N-acetylglucosamine 2-epimerase (non-hydrolysing)